MKLIADSGATRAEWVVTGGDQRSETFITPGFNPYFSDTRFIEEVIEKDLVPFIDTHSIEEIYFYGAGCSTISKCTIVEDALTKVFHNAHTEIHHDLLGAARALFGRNEGIACILGTGSNSCYYDGNTIVENVPSLGYLFGDEGSGAYLGKMLLSDYLKGNISASVRKAFDIEFGLNLENILDSVYNKPHPNRFLASFAEFLGQHQRSTYVRGLLRGNFHDFFMEQVTKYPMHTEVPLAVVGSVGFHFSDHFKKVAAEFNTTVKRFLQSPIEGLVDFHEEF
jgi:N-acetylglucosamine kinase-like BadF-type ATPase